MAPPFPLSPVPSYYSACSFPLNRNGIFYDGDTPTVTLSRAGVVTNYTVRDYWGSIVSSGSVTSTTVTPTAPNGGWKLGWYRIYFTGASTDTLFGPSYGVTNFVIVRNSTLFPVNADSTADLSNQSQSESQHWVGRGVMGSGTQRSQIGSAVNFNTFPDSRDHIARQTAPYGCAYWMNNYWLDTGDAGRDQARAKALVCEFPNGGYDRIKLNGGTLGTVYPADTILDPSKIFIEVVHGTSTGWKINVYYPDAVTLVESWDNNVGGSGWSITTSSYIKAWDGGGAGALLSPTAIGNGRLTGVISTVGELYPPPFNVTRYEGPENEPNVSAEVAHRMRLFQANVHAGNADAKAIGPCPVDIIKLTSTSPGGNAQVSWTSFLAAGGHNYCDEISFHAYNSITNGDLNLGRATIQGFLDLLATNGVTPANKPMWHTEATNVFLSVYGVYHPRRSRVILNSLLLWEQYGIPAERNLVWYDQSHGFWSYPSFAFATDGSMAPYMPMYRVLTDETHLKAFHHKVDFGCVAANAIWLGNVYTPHAETAGASVMVLSMISYMPGATVDLTITGTTGSITYSDAFGSTSTVAQSSGRVTIPTSDIPTYVRLPAGVTATVYQVNDWGPTPPPSISSFASGKVGSTSAPQINDDGFMTFYSPLTGVFTSSNALPEAATLTFLANATFERVIIFCGGSWQNLHTLLTFTVDTWDGASWTTQKTVDVSGDATSFNHGSDSSNAGCSQETFWAEQTVFDVKFAAPVTASAVRVSATAASYGGEPNAACIAAGGQGAAAPRLSIQEIIVPSASTPGM